jgi:large subunit ribosomal protein L25
VDFYQVRKDEKLQMEVPIVLVGEAPAMRGKGRLLSRGIQNLRIECLPSKVPPQIEVDVSGLIELEQSIYVKDIVLDKDILVHADPGQLVAKVTEIIIKVEEEKVVVAAEAVAAEGEAAAGEAGAKPVAEGGAAPAAAAGGAEKAQKAEKPQKAEKK